MLNKKKTKIIKTSLLSFTLLGLGVISANAYTETYATNTWTTANYVNVPGGGTCSYRLTGEYRNVKASTSKKASLKGTTTAMLKGNTRLVNNTGIQRSTDVVTNGILGHPDTTAVKGNGYYNRACSHGIEPGNSNDITVRYSSDYLD